MNGFTKNLTAGRKCRRLPVILAVLAIVLHSTLQVQQCAAQSITETVATRPDPGTPPTPPMKPTPPEVPAISLDSESASDAPSSASSDSKATTTGSQAEVSATSEFTLGATSELTLDADEPIVPGLHATEPPSSALGEQPAGTSVRNLSVEPGTRPLLPDDMPAWTTAPPDFSSNTHRFTVSSIPVSDQDNVDEALDEPLVAALVDYVSQELLSDSAAGNRVSSKLTVDYIRKNLIDDPQGYVAELATSNGPMYQRWVSLSVTPEQRTQIQAWDQEAQQRERMQPLALGLLGLLSAIGLSHFMLRRRHGLPNHAFTDQELAPRDGARQDAGHLKQGAVAGQALPIAYPAPAEKRRCCSKLSGVGVLICVLLLPGLIAMTFLFWAVGSRTELQPPVLVEEGNAIQVIENGIDRSQHTRKVFAARAPGKTVRELPKANQEVKLRSGNQVIIIRSE